MDAKTRPQPHAAAPPSTAAAADPALSTPRFELPPRRENPDGKERRVGFELELTGIELPTLATLVADEVGGRVEEENPYRYRIAGSDLGDFTVELDWALLSGQKLRAKVQEYEASPEVRDLVARLEGRVAELASLVVPFEIVTPPIPLSQLHRVEQLRRTLCRSGAVGTGASLAYAFGLHLNPEAASFDAAALLADLRAFLLLGDWLRHHDEIDVTRRLVPFIHPFPKKYLERVLDADYAPTLGELIDDYLEDNLTRNRPLDLLPLFAHLDPERVFARLDDGDLTQPRPTYHYRLPDCRIDDPTWSVAGEWNRWVLIERLGADPDRLAAMAAAWQRHHDAALRFLEGPWRDQVEEWLHPPELRRG